MSNVLLRPVAPSAVGGAGRGLPGLLVTVLVHVTLILAWQMARKLPPRSPEGERSSIQWIKLSAPDSDSASVPAPHGGVVRAMRAEHSRREGRRAPEHPDQLAAAPVPAAPVPVDTSPFADPEPAVAPAAEGARPALPGAESVLDKARRSAGSIDRALRKERQPYITARLDSPQIRMRKGMEEAHAIARPGSGNTPMLEELVNDTGDGARRTRVVAGNSTYCVTDRAPATSIDAIEKYGRQRITTCPPHEQPARRQEWRTARD